MDRFEAAARGAYICFRSAGGKLIIVKRLRAFIWKRRYINVPLYFSFSTYFAKCYHIMLFVMLSYLFYYDEAQKIAKQALTFGRTSYLL